MLARISLSLTFLASLSAPAHADLVVGFVQDAQSNPVAGANLDIFDSATGAELTLTNDGTDASGAFAVTVPSGTYDILVRPPAPPATMLVGARFEAVDVSGVTDLGVIALQDGVLVSGRVLRAGGSPANGVGLELEDALTGATLVMTVDNTDAAGLFSTTAPLGALELLIDPRLIGPLSAPDTIELNVSGPLNLGDVQLAPGFVVSLTVKRPNGSGLAGADLDAIDSATGDKLYTPNDNTGTSGLGDFVVPAGTYTIDVCAPFVERLASALVPNVVVNSTTNAGSVTLANGRVVSGVVRNQQGVPLPGVDLDAFDTASGAPVPTCHDDTSAQGAYATVLPLGTFDFVFEISLGDCGANTVVQGVTVAANTTLDVVLDDTTIGCRRCTPAVANSSGRYGVLYVSGSTSAADADVSLLAIDLPPNQFGYFVAGQVEGFVVGPGGSQGNLCVGLPLLRVTPSLASSGAAGTLAWTVDTDNVDSLGAAGVDTINAGDTWNFQCWHRDQNPGVTSNFTDSVGVQFN